MKWYFKVLILFVVLGLIVGLGYWEAEKWKVPSHIRDKQEMVREAFSNSTIERLKNSKWGIAINFELRGQPSWLLYWTGKYMEYVPEYDYELDEVFRKRSDHLDPLAILEFGRGRCEEFAIVYGSFLKAAGYNVRIVYDVSTGISEAGKQNGDHVWIEVDWLARNATVEQIRQKYNEGYYWTHVEPTDGAIEAVRIAEEPNYSSYSFNKNKYINDPEMYERDRKKDLTDVWAVTENYAINVAADYQYEE